MGKREEEDEEEDVEAAEMVNIYAKPRPSRT